MDLQNEEQISPTEVDLTSFDTQDQLNPKIWVGDGNELKPRVHRQLMKIANDYFHYLDIEWVDIKDIIITGSLANYNYSEYSDIDLHILINYKDVDNNVELVRNYLEEKQKTWENEHQGLKIYGYIVSPYTQDTKELHVSGGIYSIKDNKWLKEPEKISDNDIDKNIVKKKSSEIINSIDNISEMFKNEEYDKVLINYKKLWEKIKKMRKHGLARRGEFSFENITFKVLRRGGYLDKLIDMKDVAYDKANSIN